MTQYTSWSQQESTAQSLKGMSYLFQDFESHVLERCFWESLHYRFMEHVQEPNEYEEFATPGGNSRLYRKQLS